MAPPVVEKGANVTGDDVSYGFFPLKGWREEGGRFGGAWQAWV